MSMPPAINWVFNSSERIINARREAIHGFTKNAMDPRLAPIFEIPLKKKR